MCFLFPVQAVWLWGAANWDEALKAWMLQRQQTGKLYRGICDCPVGFKFRTVLQGHTCIVANRNIGELHLSLI